MSEVKTYAVNCNDAWLNTEGDDISGSYVKYKDHQEVVAALEAKCAALAAENAELKSKGREVLNEACKVYDKFNANVDSDSGDFMDGQTLHEFQFVLDVETPVTDAFLAEVLAQGGAKALEDFAEFNIKSIDPFDDEYTEVLKETARAARCFAAQLRKGGEQK